MSVRREVWLVSLLVALTLAGCPSKSSSGSKKPTPNEDAGIDQSDAGVYCPEGSTTFLLQTKASGKHLTATLFDAMPNPPERYNNSWVVDFTDADGKAVEDVMITKAEVYMPFHQHGRPATWTSMPEPGRFKLALNFFMRGYFEVRINAMSESAAATNDYLVFSYCVKD